MRRFAVRILLAVALAVAAVVSGGVIWAWNGYHAAGPLNTSVSLIVPKGAGVQEIADLLVEKGVIDNAHLFVLGARYTEMARRMRAGEFAFPPNTSMKDAAEHLVSGALVKRRLTIPEGLLTREIIALVQQTDGLTGAVESPGVDGVYLPETYFFSYGDSRAGILARMKAAMEETVAKAWTGRGPKIAVKSAREALILASIIEKETGVAAERARVSAVFHRRWRLTWTAPDACGSGSRFALQYLSHRGAAPRPDRQSRPGGVDGGGPATGNERAVFRCRRQGRACVRQNAARSQPQCRKMAPPAA